ncbi:hypothetical protein FAIPA1_590014 [Frankia sp. AiPs1]
MCRWHTDRVAGGGSAHDMTGSAAGWDFFVSYTAVDREWAEWISWQLEDADYRVLVQAWDFVAGSNWQIRMQQGVQHARRTIAVLSDAYLTSVYGQAEWQAAHAADPHGFERKLLPIRVEDCPRPGLLGAVVSIVVPPRRRQCQPAPARPRPPRTHRTRQTHHPTRLPRAPAHDTHSQTSIPHRHRPARPAGP